MDQLEQRGSVPKPAVRKTAGRGSVVRKPAVGARHTEPLSQGADGGASPSEGAHWSESSAQAAPAAAGPAPSLLSADGVRAAADVVDVWDQRIARGLSFLRRRLAGAYEVDEFGFDPELTAAVFHPMLRVLYRDWFRTEVFGIENVPEHGGGLVVGNHSGTVALDALMLTTALWDQHPGDRHLRLLGADLVFRMPLLSELARKAGATVACNPDAERLMSSGELVGVFPEGFKGIGKRYSERYKLQRFGRGGFVSAALRTGTPIVPVAIVGAEEIYPILADLKPLARLLGMPYFPVTPTFPWLGPLGLVPLPSKWMIEFCPPIPTAHLTEYADDPMVVFNLADQVRETIQVTIYSLLEKRPDPFGA
ncbi:lysophospholipid acyltransferase family protein [Actinoplanes sp. NPDC051859]|uniref:lysophospholipid acyltransferase family protein n=1 Tax=Actinoplanes sp. NPDC051859 TaxID=3363909 RepID=UPI003797B5DC